ncbi:MULTISPECIES: MFS transporter [unclassified Streptomyces]|uniref:MFS transporter n=1 Tax=unclassified Streptomyces TaxID=2593676 RepID=UPI002E37A743|nr:MFS transporter [Streptomyces sp. NBC_01361]
MAERSPGHLPPVTPLSAGRVNVIRRENLKKTMRGAIVGNIMEWYDVGVFGYLVSTLGKVFLPDANSATQVIFILGTFASTYLLRPLGGLFFGWLGDRVGRKRVLFATLTLVASATFLIGVLPGYNTIGITAAVLLMVLKVIQGFSAGGELTGALSLVGESAPDRRRGFYCAILDGGSYLGFVLGAAFVTTLQLALGQDGMTNWGWRIPFLVAGPLGLIAIYQRMRMEESPHFCALLEQHGSISQGDHTKTLKVNPLRVFAQNWRVMLIAIVLVAAANSAGYAFTSYMPTYLSTVENYNATQSNLITLPLLALLAFSMPFVGLLSDRVGRKPMLIVGAVWMIVLSIPAFLLMDSGHMGLVIIGLALIGIPVALYNGTLDATYPEMFPTSSRNTSLGASYNISVAIFGGTGPVVIDYLIRATGSHLAAPYYLMGMSVAGFIAILFLAETAGKPLKGSAPNVEAELDAHLLQAAASEQACVITGEEQP